jgi:hypothetical protein
MTHTISQYGKVFIVSAMIALIGCKKQIPPEESVMDNIELDQIVLKDQETSESGELMEARDKRNRQRVMELLAGNQIRTPADKFNAALILQQTALQYCGGELKSMSPENYYLAYVFAKHSWESGYERAAYLVASTYDRFLYYTEGYQKYGTHKIYDEKSKEMLWTPIDTLTTDQEREKLGVEPLSELLKEGRMMNKLK